jgi:WD40 repeat protein
MKVKSFAWAALILLAGCSSKPPAPSTALKLDAWSSAFRPNSPYLVAGYSDGTVLIWNTKTGKKERILKFGSDRIATMAFSRDGSILATDSNDKVAHIWQWNSATPPTAIRHDTFVPAVCISPDGKTVGLVDEFRIVKLYDTKTGLPKAEFNRKSAFGMNVGPVEFSPNGKLLAAAADDGSIHIWHVDDPSSERIIKGKPGSAISLAFFNKGRYLAVGGIGGEMAEFDVSTGRNIGSLISNGASVHIAVSPNEAYLAKTGLQVKIWNLSGDKRPTSSNVVDGRSSSNDCFTSDSRYFTSFLHSDVYIYDAHTWKLVSTYQR